MKNSFAQIITRLTADAVAVATGVTPQLVAGWKHRDSIPPRYWRRLVEWSADHGHDWLTLDVLALAAEPPAAEEEAVAA